MNSDKHFDLIISGGGMVGLALAAASARFGLHCALIEKGTITINDDQPDQFSPRVSALNLASERLLTHLGAWQRIPEHRKTPYFDMNVWDGLGSGQINFNAHDVQTDHLGHIVENSYITEALWQTVLDHPEIEVFTGDSVCQWQQNETGIRVETEQGHHLSASLLTGCEGKHSPVRQKSKIEQWQWAYEHTAIVTTVFHDKPNAHVASQVFLESGPLAFLPLTHTKPGQYASSIVWSAKTERAEQLLHLDDAGFIAQLEHAFEARYGKILAIDPRFSFPLTATQSKTYIDGRVVVLGDAAHTIHPLAGLGVNLGFLDAAALADVLSQAKNGQQDCAHRFVLRRYQRQRQTHNLAVAALMEALKRLFDTQAALPVVARNLGLSLLNRQALLKRPLVLGALGDFGTPLPSLCQPDLENN
ncbi:MAG: UbiH/UbiF/VisC/COQ6 family ubiquinone biosynthesis hydroxylase [Reinekea sp.]